MYAVAGVSGRTGAATARALLKQGEKVRVLVRDRAQGEAWDHKHAEVAVCDLTDPAALGAALTGVHGAYLLLPPNPKAEDLLADRAAFLDKLVAGLKKAKLPRLLFLSSLGAQHPTGTGPIVSLYRAEHALAQLAPEVTFLRAGYFLENWADALMPALETGQLPWFGNIHTKFPQVCANDIGAAAAKLLVEKHKGVRHVELGGKENWSVEDVAVALSSLLGAKITPVGHPVDGAKDAHLAMGMNPNQAGLYAELAQAMIRGHADATHPHALTRGTTPLYESLKPLV